jgi:hypothetical protein
MFPGLISKDIYRSMKQWPFQEIDSFSILIKDFLKLRSDDAILLTLHILLPMVVW